MCLYGENTGKMNCEEKWKNLPVRHFVYLRRQNLIKKGYTKQVYMCVRTTDILIVSNI